MDEFLISLASIFDLPGVLRLERLCFGDDAWSLPDVIGGLIWPGQLRLRATLGQQIIGFAMGEPAWRSDISMITTIGVHPQFRRRGVGSSLLTECEALLPGKRIRLTVREDNKQAIHLYERFGYRYISRLWNYYRDGKSGILMEKIRTNAENGDAGEGNQAGRETQEE